MRIFVTGTSGYIGGSIATALAGAGHEVSGLVRSEASAAQVRALGITPVHGTLDDAGVLEAAATRADAVIHSANADHAPSAETLLRALEGTRLLRGLLCEALVSSFRGAPLGANPESITTIGGYGFRACAQEGASRNDGG